MHAEPGGRVLVASNRGPVSYARGEDGQLTRRRGGGGVVSGLSSVAAQAQVLWVCAALGDADRAAVAQAPGGRIDVPGIGDVRMLDIPADTFDRAYNAVANSTLWFIHHMLYDTPNQPSFGIAFHQDWEAFRGYNAAFAGALAEGVGHGTAPGSVARGGVRAMVQDYHLSLVPRMLAEARPGLPIGYFTHTPWAPPDYYRLLPDDVAREVLDGILGADHVGFHSPRWAGAFLECCRLVLDAEVDGAAATVRYRGHTTTVGVHPLGVDASELSARAAAPDVEAQVAALSAATADRKLIVRVDRTELSKNIVRGLHAYRELLLTHPEWRGQVVHLAFAYPSRNDLAGYREYTEHVRELSQEISQEFATPDWDPLVLSVEDDYARSLAAYRLADVLLVNPIRDGMNLVAKEAPLLSGRDGVLVLSREAGAADELGAGALLVNPYDVTATADALHEALSMPAAERLRRKTLLVAGATAAPPRDWFTAQLAALGHGGGRQ